LSDTPSSATRRTPDWVRYELPLLACLALIWILSNQSSLPGPGERGSFIRDLFNYGSHAVIYGVLALLARRDLLYRAAALPGWLTARPRVTAALFALTWGLLDEWHQSYIPGRTASPWDALTDLVGASLGLWLGPHLIAAWNARHERSAGTRSPTSDQV
jgi:VanZ family protein